MFQNITIMFEIFIYHIIVYNLFQVVATIVQLDSLMVGYLLGGDVLLISNKSLLCLSPNVEADLCLVPISFIGLVSFIDRFKYFGVIKYRF